MNTIYNIDFDKLVGLLTPTFLRKERMLAWLRIFVMPLKTLHYELMQRRDLRNSNSDLYRLAHNGQVCYLRKALNDNFDNKERRITLSDGNLYKPQYIYTEAENKPRYLGTMHLYREVDYSDTGVDFIVKVPLEVWQAQKTETGRIGEYRFYNMEALINYYKLAGKRYIIELL